MGRFLSSAENANERCGNIDAVSVISLWLQAVSVKTLRSDAAPSSLSFSSLFRTLRLPESVSGNNRSGFVTIGDYLCPESEMPYRGLAKMKLVASQVCRAEKRADSVDAHGMEALGGEREAGCDAGKGAFELTAGSLAEGTASAGRRDGTSTMAGMGGNERNRVKC
jgi:hypothetical protein